MKNIINILFLFCITLVVHAQDADLSTPPPAAPAKMIEIKDAQTFVLANGLKVFVVEDHRAPIVYYGLNLDIYPALEADKTGMQELFISLIGTATKTRTKEQLNRETDEIAAAIASTNRGGYARSLKKYEARMLELFSDILLNPVFHQSELDLNREKVSNGLKMVNDDARSLTGRVTAALTYGKAYPDGELTTEETLNNIGIEDFEQYHRTYFAPNVARLVIVGDITLKEAKANVEKYFGQWSKKEVPVTKYTIPVAPEQTKVAFIEKAGAVQSVVNVSYPVAFRTGMPDQMAAFIMNHIFGGGGSSRLFQSLRETHSYTYGVYSSIASGDLTGCFNLRGGAQIKAAATDSAVYYIWEEMKGMMNTPVSEQELKDTKVYIAGSFGRSLENPETIAQFAVNIDKYQLPKDYYRTYLQRLEAVTVSDVQAAAKKYLKPGNAWIIVTGDKSHAEKLTPFAGDHTVQFYDMNAQPVAAPVTKD